MHLPVADVLWKGAVVIFIAATSPSCWRPFERGTKFKSAQLEADGDLERRRGRPAEADFGRMAKLIPAIEQGAANYQAHCTREIMRHELLRGAQAGHGARPGYLGEQSS
jgi:hypothetical protein